jgi:hypothetical protein
MMSDARRLARLMMSEDQRDWREVEENNLRIAIMEMRFGVVELDIVSFPESKGTLRTLRRSLLST